MSEPIQTFEYAMTQPIADTCNDFFCVVNGEACELTIPQSRREWHMLEALRWADRGEGDHPIRMSGYTAGNAAYIAVNDEDEVVARDLFPCMLITNGGNTALAATLDAAQQQVYIAPNWRAEPIQWMGDEPDPEKLKSLLSHLSSSPFCPPK